jgi:hypothetical protein
MNQIDQIQSQLNEQMLIQMNPNMGLIPPPNIPPLINNHQNLPINQIGIRQQVGNNPQNEDTSKILLILNLF